MLELLKLPVQFAHYNIYGTHNGNKIGNHAAFRNVGKNR